MTAEELKIKFHMTEHEENGAFTECHYDYNGDGRASSGSIYYYVAAGEKTKFHVIDCDEYWSFIRGETLEIWMINPQGMVSRKKLGIDGDAEPLVYIPRGTIFASRSLVGTGEGTFLSCITVPRFDYKGFTLLDEETICSKYPQAEKFYKNIEK